MSAAKPWSYCLVFVWLPAIAACDDGGGSEAPAEALTLKQQYLPAEDFEAVVEADDALAATVAWVQSTRSVDHITRAVTMEDAEGVSLVAARYAGASGEEATVVRHCKDGDCASVVVDEPFPGEVAWTNAAGPVALRTVLPSYLLRELDPDDPIRTAVLAVPGQSSEPDVDTQTGALDEASAPTPKSPNRKVQLRSIFGVAWGFSMDSLVQALAAGGFANGAAGYHVTSAELDNDLATLGPDDALVWIGHGDKSKKSGKVVGMSTTQYVYFNEHYNVSRIHAQLAKNPNNGPGILFLAGCISADLLPQLSNGRRVTLGFTGKVEPGLAYRVAKAFFARLTQGGTIKEGVADGNAELAKAGASFKLVADGGDQDKKWVSEPGSEPEPPTCPDYPAIGEACGGCIEGFECSTGYWGTGMCEQKVCPEGAGRTNANDCCCDCWEDKSKVGVYDPCRTGFLLSCVPRQ